MLENIIKFSIRNKLIVVLFTLTIVGFGLYSIYKMPVGTVPDITNNQVQVITTSSNLSTQEIEMFITAPVEMEMANLPGVVEIRSISKFGISMVTVVFRDNMGTYLPRQLIAEKIKSASEKIPEEYGTPEMGPISTGLGEIYQYILDVKPGYEDIYTPMELRTIQDWNVKRRLSGIDGVVEVNSWGGYLKQYEVALKPDRLNEYGVDLMEVFDAIENNNQISGAAYIEKNNQSYFIRGDGQIKDIEDIESIVVKRNGFVPITIRDVASVQFGYANRFGAITANGKGETILGQVMMLKDANSQKVIKAVKERVDEIQKNLPEGVFINPILERGELIAKTSHTVAENLILGAIIVFFTVLILIGNFRSALVIASMIPLALLFTVWLRFVFGIDANLMSLGALDFGIIIDGAVIIVEFIVLRMALMKDSLSNIPAQDRMALKDKIALEGASKMMKSAIFGQIIILIVFIPILSLSGVEGKMFRPMAMAFSFAIIGAMIMGLTWLPVASSLFLKPGDLGKRNLSKRLMELLQKLYLPVIAWSCSHKKIVLSAAIASLILTGIVFSKLGGEFVPTLDEGDFVIQPALKTGTSLSETIHTTTRMEQILIAKFPDEVDQIVCRIGAAEVPTDPMSMEEIDMIIKLFPKKQWTKADSKEDLAGLFKDELSIIPGIEYEFTQPIEMRFNELITGVRSDIAIKVYGDDLDYINDKASVIKSLIEDIPGASDVILEKTTGLPQIKVAYDRKAIASYGMDINTLNAYLSSAIGGKIAGVIFEGEKRFDLVMRMDVEGRNDIGDIRSIKVQLPEGGKVPLSELAVIDYTKGPAKISRDNTHRRVVVSVNVRDRDLQSVVEDIQAKIDENIKLLPGNYIEYGGQFENLQNATKRLIFVVPIALLLIFIFLHFAFQSLKDAIMIFTAIPLATVGGVMLLWLRGMPFSVSAGVGFVALFGIAVLNGIVLIEHLKDMQRDGKTCIRDIIIKGTRDRLRPVLLTAGAAAMGFFPMAISSGAGAEVQRPLATVVIGGLITSTMLTLIALPLLFEIFYNVIGIKFFPLRFIRSKTCGIVIFLLLVPGISAFSQRNVGLDELSNLALKNNLEIKMGALDVEKSKVLERTAFQIPKTSLTYGLDENNIAENGYPLKVWGITQDFDFPTYYFAQKNSKFIETAMSKVMLKITKNELLKEVAIAYYDYLLLDEKIQAYYELDSIYQVLYEKAEKQFHLKNSNKLDLLNIQSKKNSYALKVNQLETGKHIVLNRIYALVNESSEFSIQGDLEILPMASGLSDSLLWLDYLQLKNKLANNQIKIEQAKSLPNLSLNYFAGSNAFDNSKLYHGFEFGLAIPLAFGSYKAEKDAAKLASESQSLESKNSEMQLRNKLFSLITEQQRYFDLLQTYEDVEIPLANEIKRVALRAYELKQIDFLNLANSLENSANIKLNFYENIYNYNRLHIMIKYFNN